MTKYNQNNNYLIIINLLLFNVIFHNKRNNMKNIKMMYKTFSNTLNNNKQINNKQIKKG